MFLGIPWQLDCILTNYYCHVKMTYQNTRYVLLVEETGRVPGENHGPAASHRQTLSHNVISSTHCHEGESNSQLY